MKKNIIISTGIFVFFALSLVSIFYIQRQINNNKFTKPEGDIVKGKVTFVNVGRLEVDGNAQIYILDKENNNIRVSVTSGESTCNTPNSTYEELFQLREGDYVEVHGDIFNGSLTVCSESHYVKRVN